MSDYQPASITSCTRSTTLLCFCWSERHLLFQLTSVLATFPLCVMFLLCFSLAMRILCFATIFRSLEASRDGSSCALFIRGCSPSVLAPPLRQGSKLSVRRHRKPVDSVFQNIYTDADKRGVHCIKDYFLLTFRVYRLLARSFQISKTFFTIKTMPLFDRTLTLKEATGSGMSHVGSL